MKISHLLLSIGLISCQIYSAQSNRTEKSLGFKQHETDPRQEQKKGSLLSTCANATAQVDLDINNVKAKLLNGGDMWWDLLGSQTAKYEIPKGSGKNSLFTGSIWIGGIDAGGQLKSAAQTYRQVGNDFWPGPLTASATTDASTCASFDKFWKIDRTDVQSYYNWVSNGSTGSNPVSSTAMTIINSWPAYGPEGQAMAPYFDYNGNGIYDPEYGDCPGFDVNGNLPCGNKLYGDQAIWWVFNDAGNTHGETGCPAIGIEIQTQAFAYSTSNDLNNATFYKYKIINKSSFRLDSTFFGQFVDPDLGTYSDDYIGCDVTRGLGYCYNGTSSDAIYGSTPPAIGIDFLEGPFANPDGIDNPLNSTPNGINYGDGTIDNEHLGMSKFVYYNNDATNYGNPVPGDDYYQYLTGTWKNGAAITYGGNGHSGSLKCSYMFPGNSDPVGWGVGGTTNSPLPQSAWTESSASNIPGDRRFLQASGPFTLQPGAVNNVTIGVIWAQAASGGAQASLQAMLTADDAIQNLFNNCFSLLSINESYLNTINARIYPNPFSDQTTLFIENTRNDSFEFFLYDLTGKSVKSIKNFTGNKLIIAKDELPIGTYIYELRNTKNEFTTGKIIIK